MPSKINFFILQFIVVFIPASLVLYFAFNSGALPDNDYWTSISDVLSDKGGFSSNISDWIVRNNEHYVLLPKLVYAANIVMTGGNNVGLSFFAWFMALMQVFLLYRFIPVKKDQYPFLFTVLLFVIAAFVFSPRQAHNWILGMSGVAWISANFFSISALVSLQQYARTGQKADVIKTIGLSICAVATYSTSLALFPTLIVAIFLLKLNRLDQIMIATFSLLILGIYFTTYSTPSYHPPIERSFLALATYFLAFIGALFTVQLNYALIIGFLGLMSSVYFIFYIYKKQTGWTGILLWVFIQLYACGNAAMAGLARSGFGVEQAFSSRYGSLPALFWLSWIMIAFTFCQQQRLNVRKVALGSLFCLSTALVFLNYLVGILTAIPLLERAEKKSLTMAAVYSHAYDLELVHETMMAGITFAGMEEITQRLAINHHVPFNGFFKDCPKIGSRLTHFAPSVAQQYVGFVDQIKLRNDLVIEVAGWAYNKDNPVPCIALTNGNNIVKGIAFYGLSRPDISKVMPTILSTHTGWQGYGKIDSHDKLVKVYMLKSKNQYWVPLTGHYQINRQAPYFKKI